MLGVHFNNSPNFCNIPFAQFRLDSKIIHFFDFFLEELFYSCTVQWKQYACIFCERYNATIVCFVNRGILKWNPDNREEKYYLKYVLAVRSLRDKIVGPTDDIVEVHDCVVYIDYWKGVL